jgi:peptide/nickel transport system ATP-binding protein/peptide/nickel transport system permease protein
MAAPPSPPSELVQRGEELVGSAQPAAPRGRLLRRLVHRKAALVGLVGVLLVLGVALFAGPITRHDPLDQDIENILAPPVWAGGARDHLLGTDPLGRDVASRLAYGARTSLQICVAAALLGAVLGLVTGSISGFYRGWVDGVTMRLGDIQLAFPFVLLAIAVLGVIPDRKPIHLILVLGIPGWIVYARVVRSRVLAERDKDYVLAARALGSSRLRTLVRYVLPSVWQVVPVIMLLDLGFLIIIESMLSFFGLGITPPTPSWGGILADGRQYMVIAPWLPVLPGLAIMVTVLSVNLAADGLADVLDPKLAKATFRREALRLPAPYREEESDEAPPLLRVRDLRVDFPFANHTVHAVRGVSFDLERGRTLGIVGESGSGKSVTALAVIQLLDSPGRVTEGSILFDGHDLPRVSDREMAALRGRRIAMIFQNPSSSLNPVLTIGFQLVETLREQLGLSKAQAGRRARDALAAVGIGDPDRVLRRYPFQLSGGMNQRVMIAMAMTCEPDVLIADEPSTALDVTTQAQILEQLRDVTRRSQTSLILITHDIAVVAEYADAVLVMYAGQVCETGPLEAVVSNPSHPYTRALLGALPRADVPRGTRLEAIPGEPPDPADPPVGCPFAPRCPHVMDVCRSVNPPPFAVGPERTAACHLWAPERAEAVAR